MKGNFKIKFLLFPLVLFFLSGCASLISSRQPINEINKKYSPKQLKEDLDFLIQTYEQVHPNLYLFTSKKIIDSTIAFIRNKLNSPITSFEFYKLVMPNISKLVDGHTLINLPYQFRKKYLDEGGGIVPFEVRIDDQRLFVRNNYSSDSTLASNSEIISINSVHAKEILNELRKYKSGEFKEFVNNYVQIMFKPLIWAHYGFGEHFNVEYISSMDNQHYTKMFLGVKRITYDSLLQRNKNFKQKYQKWTFNILNDEKIAIIDLNTFSNSDDLENFNKFLDSTFTIIHNEDLQNLIIDVRGNGGGESLLGEALIDYLALEPWVMFSKADFRISEQIKSDMIPWVLRWIPIKTFTNLFSFMYTSMGIENIEFDSVKTDLLHVYMKPSKLEDNPLRYNGNIYVLIDNSSFSMSVMFAAFMKDYGLATLIGEETGQSANPYGGNYVFDLPNTQLRASVPSARSYRPSGLDTKRGVIPDFIVKQNLEDLKNSIDTVMEFTKQLIKEKNNNVEAAR